MLMGIETFQGVVRAVTWMRSKVSVSMKSRLEAPTVSTAYVEASPACRGLGVDRGTDKDKRGRETPILSAT